MTIARKPQTPLWKVFTRMGVGLVAFLLLAYFVGVPLTHMADGLVKNFHHHASTAAAAAPAPTASKAPVNSWTQHNTRLSITVTRTCRTGKPTTFQVVTKNLDKHSVHAYHIDLLKQSNVHHGTLKAGATAEPYTVTAAAHPNTTTITVRDVDGVVFHTEQSNTCST